MPRWRRRSNGYVVFVALLVLLSAAAAIRLTLDDHGFSLLKTPPGEAVALDTSQHALTVTAVHPRQLPWRDSMQVFGPVEPWQEAVIAAQVPGLRLARLDADVGDIVARSQVLARYDDEPLRHHRDQIAANLAEAKASAREAVSTFERSRRMLGGGGISEQDFVRAKSDSEIARARVDALRAQLATAELQIRQARILAPDDGVVSARARPASGRWHRKDRSCFA